MTIYSYIALFYLSEMGLSDVSKAVTPPVTPRAKKKYMPARSLGCRSFAMAFSSFRNRFERSFINLRNGFTKCHVRAKFKRQSTNTASLFMRLLISFAFLWYFAYVTMYCLEKTSSHQLQHTLDDLALIFM